MVLLTLAGIFFFAHHTSGSSPFMDQKSSGAHKTALYSCPMHPAYTSDKPGDCPICGMRLVPVDKTANATNAIKDPNAVCIMHKCPMMKKGQKCPMMVLAEKGEKVKCPVCGEWISMGSEGDLRKILFYRHPMRPEVTSPVPAKDEMGMDYIPVYSDEAAQLTLEGGQAPPDGYAPVLITPERQQLIGIRTHIVERKNGFKMIHAAGRIAYDPDLYQAEAEYIESFRTLRGLKNDDGKWASKLMDSAKTKLTHMGLNSQMIEALQTQEGPDKSLLYAIPGGDAWVYANIYEYEISLVKVGDELKIDTLSSSGGTLKGNIRAIDTVVDAATRTVRVRAVVKNEGGILKPDMYVNVQLETALGNVILVPEEAVFFAGKTNIVFVDKGEGLFEPRQVTLGQKAGDSYVVSGGLSENEKVITNGNFLVDSESKLKAALNRIGGHSHGS